jgi:hypothetical protein
MVDIRAALAEHLRGHASPVLFVGSGLSRRYAGAENWEGLLRYFAAKTSRPYDFYRSKADSDFPAIASEIAQTFNSVWWDDDEFKASRDINAAAMKSQESPLKIEVARHLAGLADRLPTAGPLAAELDLLRASVVDGIITTNYDDILPALFPDFRTFIGQDGLLFANPQGIGELYQIHGSVTDPDSLVLTAADYARFEERNAYLAAKLMTIFVEHPVVFLGYSLSDRNVCSILTSIAGCLTPDNISKLRDQLIFVEWAEEAEASIGQSTIMIGSIMLPVIQVKVPDFTAVYTALTELRRRFPAKLLRRLKEQVYELVLTDDPHNRLLVADIDEDTKDVDVDVVFGVGTRAKLSEQGYVGLTRANFIDDVLGDRTSYDARQVVDQALPHILRSHGFVPVHKYLRAVDALDDTGMIKRSASVSSKIKKMAGEISGGMPSSKQFARKAPDVLASIGSISQLEAEHGPEAVIRYGTCMPAAKVDTKELRYFLNANRHFRNEDCWEKTQYIKLVCYLDWLENGPRPSS